MRTRIDAGTRYTRRAFLKLSARTGTGFALLSSVPSLLKGSFPSPEACVTRAQYLMGTVVTITAYGESKAHACEAIGRAFDAIRHADELMSLYKSGSDVSRLNRAAGREEVEVHPSVIEIIEESRRFTAATGGSFDISIEPLMRLWGFRSRENEHSRSAPNCIAQARRTRPTERELSNALESVGMRHVVTDRSTGRAGLLRAGTRIDLGGIAVGFSVDRAVEQLRRAGIECAFINHSGDAYALGAPPESDGWEIAIPDPLEPREIRAAFTLRDRAVSTSGNYEKYLVIGDQKVGHILRPLTGMPACSLLSATIFAPTALEADAYSTGLFCVGQEALEVAARQSNDLELFAVTEENKELRVRSI